jgi:low temperature requirement protein LtrA
VIAATTTAVGALTEEQGWSPAAVVITASGLLLAAGFWWTYFLVPSRTVLQLRPQRTFAWRYAHLPLFGAIAAVGAGLRVAAEAVEHGQVPPLAIALALGLPVAATIVVVFVTWSALMHSADRSHVPLFLLSLLPVAAAIAVAVRVAPDGLELERQEDQTALVLVIGLIALAPVIEVVGHEIVGYRHTVRVLEREGVLDTDG